MQNQLPDSPKSFTPPPSPSRLASLATIAARDKVKKLLIDFERTRRINSPNDPCIATTAQANEIRHAAVDLMLAAQALINNVDDWITRQQPPLPK